jgi:hypothetical protein
MHTRLLKCALEVEDSRAYWDRTDGTEKIVAKQAFDEYWFGARSLSRVEVLLANFRARFAEFPSALRVLHNWSDMAPDTRKLICHWHVQLTDPLYRSFTGDYLLERRAHSRVQITRDLVIAWIGKHGAERWTTSTRIQFASKLLSCVYSAGLVSSNRDPRPLTLPRVSDDALGYIIYLLRRVEFAGTLLDNPYLASVGLSGTYLEERLRTFPGMQFRRQANLIDFGWRHEDLDEWWNAQTYHSRNLPAGGLK